MFRHKTAWFSSSVPPSAHDFWRSEGGVLASWKTADYLFSDDATCPDTLRVFESKDYLCDHVTPFHSLFLSVCEKRRSAKSVCIGHYVLPPAPVQDEVRHMVGRFIWEREDKQPVTQVAYKVSIYNTEDECCESDASTTNSESFNADVTEEESSVCCEKTPVSDTLTGYVCMDNLQKYCGELRDFHQTCYRCANCNVHCCALKSEY